MRTADASSGRFAQMSRDLDAVRGGVLRPVWRGLGYTMRLVRKGPVTDEGKGS